MKKLLLIIVLLANLGLVFSQDFDLIVKSNGDSIACHIDSITDTHIYFERKYNKYWRHTLIRMADIIEFQRNAINKKFVVFKNGTSNIEKIIPQPTSIRDIQKNSVYAGIFSINYSRMLPAGENIGFTVGGGFQFLTLGMQTNTNILIGLQAETNIIIGGPKNFFEPGIYLYYSISEFYFSVPESDGPHLFLPMIRTGYRYQSPQGFLFRGGLLTYFFGVVIPCPTLSIGYSF